MSSSAAKSLQSCPTLCDPIDGSLPGSPVPGILQARTLEWVAISFSNVWKWKAKVKLLSHVRLLGTPWTAAYQAPPSMVFSRQEYWSELPLPSLPLILPCWLHSLLLPTSLYLSHSCRGRDSLCWDPHLFPLPELSPAQTQPHHGLLLSTGSHLTFV